MTHTHTLIAAQPNAWAPELRYNSRRSHTRFGDEWNSFASRNENDNHDDDDDDDYDDERMKKQIIPIVCNLFVVQLWRFGVPHRKQFINIRARCVSNPNVTLFLESNRSRIFFLLSLCN